MKRIIKYILIALTALSLILCVTSSTAVLDNTASKEKDAQLEKVYSSCFIKYQGQETQEWKDYILTGKLNLKRDTVIVKDSNVYLKKGSVLVINKDADLVVRGSLTIEQGAKVYIKNGTLDIQFSCENYGKIIVRKNGLLNVSGVYSSGGYSGIKLEGKAKFGSAELSEVLESIADKDKSFGLDKCAVFYFGKANYIKQDKLQLYYRIGNILTDYCYTLDPTNDPSSLSNGDISAETVYDKKLSEKITSAAEKYLAKSRTLDKFADTKNIFGLSPQFRYSFKTGELIYEEIYFEFGLSPLSEGENAEGMFYEQGYSKTIKL